MFIDGRSGRIGGSIFHFCERAIDYGTTNNLRLRRRVRWFGRGALRRYRYPTEIICHYLQCSPLTTTLARLSACKRFEVDGLVDGLNLRRNVSY